MISSGAQGLLQITRKHTGFVSGSQHYEWRTCSKKGKRRIEALHKFSHCALQRLKNDMRMRNKMWCYQGLKTQHLDKNYSRKGKGKLFLHLFSSWFFSSKTNKIKKNFYVQFWKGNLWDEFRKSCSQKSQQSTLNVLYMSQAFSSKEPGWSWKKFLG